MKAYQAESLVSFIKRQMQESGFTEKDMQYSGMRATLSSDNLHYQGLLIPYFDIAGNITTKRVVRVMDVVDDNYDNEHGGKYRIVGGGKKSFYYPSYFPGMAYALSIQKIATPLVLVEGEKKACRTQRYFHDTSGRELEYVCVGIPGVWPSADLIKELESGEIPLKNRIVFLAFDFNSPNDKADADTRAAEERWAELLVTSGAIVYLLRWSPAAGGEQKIDEWLAAGGDLRGAINWSKNQNIHITHGVECELIIRDFNKRFVEYQAHAVDLEQPDVIYSITDLRIHTASEKMPCAPHVGKGRPKKPEYVADAWVDSPLRLNAKGFCCLPAPLGDTPVRLIHRDDGVYVNAAVAFPTGVGEPDPQFITDFDTALRRFCENDEQFMWAGCYLAHAFLHPAEKVATVLALTDTGGSGKSTILEILGKVAGDLYCETGIEFTTDYNGGLAGKIIIGVDDPKTDKASVQAMSVAIRSYTGKPKMKFNTKYGKVSKEMECLGRVIIATNRAFTLSLENEDRRYCVLGCSTTMPRDLAARLHTNNVAKLRADWLGWVNSWALRVLEWDCCALPPRGERHAAALNTNKPQHVEFLEMDELWDVEVITGQDLWRLYCWAHAEGILGSRAKLSRNTLMHNILEYLHTKTRNVTIGGTQMTCYFLKNSQKWHEATYAEVNEALYKPSSGRW